MPDSPIPQHLYKYVQPERVDVLQKLLIRFTPPAEFNDPFEAFPAFQSIIAPGSEDALLEETARHIMENPDEITGILDEELDKLPPGQAAIARKALAGSDFTRMAQSLLPEVISNFTDTVDDQLQGKIQTQIRERLNTTIGILSLSAVANDILMWGHYCDSHRGFLIEFDAQHPFFDSRKHQDNPIGLVRPVTYVDERPAFSFLDLTRDPEEFFLELIDFFFFTKSAHWAYENEWRQVRSLTDADHEVEGNILLFSVPPSVVTGIVLGARAGSEFEASLRGAIDSNSLLEHVEFRKATLSHRGFEVLIPPRTYEGEH